MSGITYPFEFEHAIVGASETAAPIGNTTAKTYLHRVIVTTTDNNHTDVSIAHDSHTHLLVPAGAGKGVYSIELNLTSDATGWTATTSANSSLIAVYKAP